jgi:hypothetical protein
MLCDVLAMKTPTWHLYISSWPQLGVRVAPFGESLSAGRILDVDVTSALVGVSGRRKISRLSEWVSVKM